MRTIYNIGIWQKKSREWEIILIFKFFIKSKLFETMAYSYWGFLISYNCFKNNIFFKCDKTSFELNSIKKIKRTKILVLNLQLCFMVLIVTDSHTR